jgi:hypothetical protein
MVLQMGGAYLIDNSNSNSNNLLLGACFGRSLLGMALEFGGLGWGGMFSRLIRTDTLIIFVVLKCISNKRI